MANFIQPYSNSQTQAKDIILARKGSQGLNASQGPVDAYTLNQLKTIYSQEINGGGMSTSGQTATTNPQ